MDVAEPLSKNSPVPVGTRDTNEWYAGVDPLSVVDPSLVQFVAEHAGKRILDLGSGPAGYSARLAERGFDMVALDINEAYVRIATRRLGVSAAVFDGTRIPLPDKSVDSVMMIEVLEHVRDPSILLAEVARVARKGLIASVPNCTQSFAPAPVVFEHMLDVDHKNFFTVESLTDLLRRNFAKVDITEIVPVDDQLARLLLPYKLRKVYQMARKYGLIKPSFYFRLLAVAEV
jgi:ubiquinone/menaquinone biosynthesis C-methylase UbiE